MSVIAKSKFKSTILLSALVIAVGLSVLSEGASDLQNELAENENTLNNKQYEKLWDTVRLIQKERNEYYQRQTDTQNKINISQQTSEQLSAIVDELQKQNEELDKEMEQIQSDIDLLQRQTQENSTANAAISRIIDQFISKEIEQIKNGIPYQREEKQLLLTGSLENGQNSISDILGRVWKYAQQELRIAKSGQTYSDKIELSQNRIKNARLFRVGHMILGYLLEDGTQAGIWSQDTGWEHNLKFDQTEAVRKAIDILDRRTVPQWVRLETQINIIVTKQQNTDSQEENAQNK